MTTATPARTSRLNRMRLFDYCNYAFFIALCFVFLYPMLLTLSLSFSDPAKGKVTFLPNALILDSYRFLLSDGRILRYFANSVFYAVAGTAISLLLTSLMAYPFTVPDFRGKKVLNLFMVITMFFSGGLIPYYFVVRELKMIDTIWVMLIPGAVGAYTVIIFRTFFSGIPHELRESAYLDGAGHYSILFFIILPVSMPLLATFALFGMVGKWNDFFTALIFLRNQDLMPVQMLLRKMLVLVDFRDVQNKDMQLLYTAVNPRSMKCAAVIVTILPIMCVYPFLQKYFVKGIMVGALKT